MAFSYTVNFRATRSRCGVVHVTHVNQYIWKIIFIAIFRKYQYSGLFLRYKFALIFGKFGM